MKKLILAGAICAIAIPTYAAARNQKPGKWEITSEIDMPGMTQKMPPMTHTICITKEDLDKPESMVPKPTKRGGEERSDCKISDMKEEGNSVSWTINCGGERPMTGSGKITYTPESYTGNMDMKMGEREVHVKYSGKYLGECDTK